MDKDHLEVICEDCKVILELPYPYVAGKRIKLPMTHNYSIQRKGINTRSKHEPIPAAKITNYHHNLTDDQIMIYGHKGHYHKH